MTWDAARCACPPYANKFAADIVLKPAPGVKVTGGSATISYPYTGATSITGTCGTPGPTGVTCAPSYNGTFTFAINADPGLTWDQQTGSGVSSEP